MHPKNKLFIVILALSGFLTAQSAGHVLKPPPVAQLLAEDASSGAPRFAAPLPVSIAPASAQYTQKNGGYTWSYTVTVPGAHGLSLLLEDVFLPFGGGIHFGGAMDGGTSFTPEDVSNENRLFTRFLPGETVILTYTGPLPETPPFRIVRVDYIYRPELIYKDFGDANDCHVNANCPAGDGWEDEKSGNCRIQVVVEEGVGFCSGNLINNTARDGRPLLLTGFHCMDGFTPIYDVWTFDFDFRSVGCETPATMPSATSFLGCTELAGRQESDYLLLEITDPSFVAEDHYFAGWDRSDGAVEGSVLHFHHPRGDIQKVGVAAMGMDIITTTTSYGNGLVLPRNHHFRATYTTGTFEPGSSGSAFFDEFRRIRGHLTGGNPSCPGETEAFVGRMFQHWGYGLSDFLDPLGTGAVTLDGEDLLTNLVITGSTPRPGIELTFRWTLTDSTTVTTGVDGSYRVLRPNNVGAFTLRGSYDQGPLDEEVDVIDVIAIRRHILGLDTLSGADFLAADVNGSGTIRTSDIIGVTRVILATGDWGERPNWIVLPQDFPLDPIPETPFAPIGLQLNNQGEREIVIDWQLIKTGNAK